MTSELMRDGENQAVRYFLAYYGGGTKQTVKKMQRHLWCCGYPYWPAWVDDIDEDDDEHLTKAGAQDWLRHLFALENKQ